MKRRSFLRVGLGVAGFPFISHAQFRLLGGDPLALARQSGSQCPDSIQPSDVLAYYKLDEAGPFTPAADSSGAGRTATSHDSNAQIGNQGRINTGLKTFSASTGYQVPGGAGSQWDSSGGWPGVANGNSNTGSGRDFTVAIWFNTFGGALLGSGSAFFGQFSGAGWAIIDSNVNQVAYVETGQASPVLRTFAVQPLVADSNWHFLAGGHDHTIGTNGGAWSMLDGGNYVSSDGHATGNDFGSIHGVGNLTIGNYSDFSIGFPANIDEASVYGRKLTQAEVTALWNGGTGARPACL
jgi:hypothetical protein